MDGMLHDLKLVELSLKDAFILEPKEFYDRRGAFLKLYNREILARRGIEPVFPEDYISISKRGVIRGLHYQLDPFSQAKLVHCIKGEVFDVLVDLRMDSPTFGNWESVLLSEKNRLSVYIPRGFAHGFLSMKENSIVSYKADNDYSTSHERTLLYNDKELDIEWPAMARYTLSEKDRAGVSFKKAEKFNNI